MNELYQVLDGLHLNVDFHNEKRLIDDGLLESLDIVMLVDELMRWDLSRIFSANNMQCC